MDIGQQIAVYLGIILILWYAGASYYNRRLGVNTYRWLQAGLAGLGEITEAKWIGSSGSGARIGIAQAKTPFRRLEAAFLLETRELLPLWLINRLRGKRDTLYLRAQLRSIPQGELEILPDKDSRLRSMDSGQDKNPWSLSDAQLPAGFRAVTRGRSMPQLLEALAPLLEHHRGDLRRISIGRTSPQLIVEVSLTTLKSSPAENLFSELMAVFRPVGGIAQS